MAPASSAFPRLCCCGCVVVQCAGVGRIIDLRRRVSRVEFFCTTLFFQGMAPVPALRLTRTYLRNEDAYAGAVMEAALDREYHRWREVCGSHAAPPHTHQLCP